MNLELGYEDMKGTLNYNLKSHFRYLYVNKYKLGAEEPKSFKDTSTDVNAS